MHWCSVSDNDNCLIIQFFRNPAYYSDGVHDTVTVDDLSMLLDLGLTHVGGDLQKPVQ